MTGTLGLFSLVDLFQLFSSSSRTGRLSIEHPRGIAKVYFDKGQVVHADFTGEKGIEAIYNLFSDERGRFEFKAGLSAMDKTIELSTENLLLEVIRRIDESKRPAEENKKASPDSAIPLLTDKMSNTNLTLYDKEILVLKVVDGKKNIRQIAEAVSLEVDLVRQIINRLTQVGALTFKTKKVKTARLYAQVSHVALSKKSVGIDNNLINSWSIALGKKPSRIACRRDNGKVYVFHIQEVENSGQNILFARDVLLALNLTANTELLVKPVN